MREIYSCLDGREALLQFNEDDLIVSVTSLTGEDLGFFQFEFVDENGEALRSIEHDLQPASVRQTTGALSEAWQGQGIVLRALNLVSDETHLPAISYPTLNNLPRRTKRAP